MPPALANKKPVTSNQKLPLKVDQAHALTKQENTELRKEVARLQKMLVKSEVKHLSEISALKAKLKQKVTPIKIIIGDAVKPSA